MQQQKKNQQNQFQNDEDVKKQFINRILDSIKESFEQTQKTANQKNFDQNKNEPKIQMTNNAMKNLFNNQGQINSLKNTLLLDKKLGKSQKDNYLNILEKLYTIFYSFTSITKSFPVKVNPFFNNLILKDLNIFKQTQDYLEQLQSQCFCFYSQIKEKIQNNMEEIQKNSIFWEKFSGLEAREGQQDIFLSPQFQEQDFVENIKNIINQYPQENIVITKVIENVVSNISTIKPVSNQLSEAHEYLFGIARSQQIDLALQIYNNEADLKNINAINSLAQIYLEGKFVKTDINKCLNFVQKSIDQHNSQGYYLLGKIIQQEKQSYNIKNIKEIHNFNNLHYMQKTIECFNLAIKQNHQESICQLAEIYTYGFQDNQIKIDQNLDKAIQLYEKANNYSKAIHNLAILLLQKYQDQKAFQLINQCYKNYYIPSIVSLGICFEQGLGVNQDLDKALNLFEEAYNKQNLQGQYLYAFYLLKKSVDSQNYEGYFKSFQIFSYLVSQDENAYMPLYQLGFMYENSFFVKQDMTIAFSYYKKSADLGYADAITKLGDYFYSGILFKKDLDKAQKLYELAAQKGNQKACENLGAFYEDLQDFQQSKIYYEKAIQNGSQIANLSLGLLYKDGSIKSETINQEQTVEKLFNSAIQSGDQLVYSICYNYQQVDTQ